MPDWLVPPRPLRLPPTGGATRLAMFGMLLCIVDRPPTFVALVVLVDVTDAVDRQTDRH